jgi:hypothetical protein
MPAALSPIDANAVHFREFLSGAKIEVPSLQRPFAWDKEEIVDFVTDMNQMVEKLAKDDNHPTEHLLGTVVLIQSAVPNGSDSVVDGQQRLTVVTLTLGLIQAEMKYLRDKAILAGGPQSEEIANQLLTQINFIQERLWIEKFQEATKPRFTPSPEVRNTYYSLISGGNGEIDEEREDPAIRLRTVAAVVKNDFVRNEQWYEGVEIVEKMRHLIRISKVITEKLLFVAVVTTSSETGYDLFEVLNARGEELKPIDLIKTWIMARLTNHDNKSEVDEITEKVRLLSIDKKSVQENYLKAFFKARTAQNLGKVDLKPTSRRVRKLLFQDPTLGDEFGHTDESLRLKIIEEVRLMAAWYGPFKKIKEGNWPYQAPDEFGQSRLRHLIGLENGLSQPLLLQASQKLPANEFLSLVHTIEKVFFRYKTICDRHPGKLDAIYCNYIRVLDSTGRLNLASLKSDLQKLLTEEASDELFALLIKENVKYESLKQPMIRYFLQTLDLYRATPAPAKVILADVIHIEHIGPQSPKSGKAEILNSDIHRLGNLCLLTGAENQMLKNEPFAKKLEIVNGLKAQQKDITSKISREFFDTHTSWDSTQLEAREEALIAFALKVFTANSGSL